MSTQVNGAEGKSDKTPETPAALEAAIQDRRDHLAATIDELTTRAKPKEIARRAGADLQVKFRAMTHTPDGQLRTERLAAVGGAVAVLGAVMVLLRHRRNR